MQKRTHRRLTALLTILLFIAPAAFAAAARHPRSGAKRTGARHSAAASKRAAGSRGKSTRARGRRGRSTYRGPTAPSPARVREIQTALARSGHYQGAPTGSMDAQTRQALAAFQQAKKLEVTGKLNVRTLKELEKYGLPANTYVSASPASPPAAVNQ